MSPQAPLQSRRLRRSGWFLALLLGLVVASADGLAAPLRPATEHPNPITLSQIHAAHPRIWFNSSNLALLQARWNHSAYDGLRQSIAGSSHPLHRALVYLATGDASHARAAITDALQYGTSGGNGEREAGFSDTVALVFDWCYAELTPTEKSQLVSLIGSRMSGYKQGFLERFQWHENYLFGSLGYFSTVLAIEGEAGTTSELRDAQTMLQNLQELGDEVSADGAYQPYFYQGVIQTLPFFMWDTATDLDFPSRSLYAQNVHRYALRRLSPSGERFQRGPGDDDGDETGYMLADCDDFPAPGAYMIGAHFQDPLGHWLGDVLRDGGHGLGWPCGGAAWLNFIYYDLSAPRQSPADASEPLAKLFSANGQVHLRSGWNIANGAGPDTRVWFYNGPRTTHSRASQNHFTVWRGDDDLIITGGNYYGSPSDYEDRYFGHAIARNTVLFTPNGSTAPDVEGGQINTRGLQPWSGDRYPLAHELVYYLGETSYRGELVVFDDTPLRTILSGDAGIAYDHDHVWSADGSLYYLRDFVYLKDDVILVRDRFAVQDVSAVRAVFHTRAKPTIDASLSVVEGNADAGILEGAARRLTIERGQSAATLEVLWPTDALTRLVGGIGYEHWVDGASSDPAQDAQSWLMSHWELPVRMGLSDGQWRIEIETDPASADGDVITAVLVGAHGAAVTTGLALEQSDGERRVTVTRDEGSLVVVFPANESPYILGEVTCTELGAECGTISDGLGGTVDCGTCTDPETCGGAGIDNQCGRSDCDPLSCADQPGACGEIPDGCGGVVDCGPCPLGAGDDEGGCSCSSVGGDRRTPWLLALGIALLGRARFRRRTMRE
ncbi:MAG: heparinase II/III family protein [Deltaproteobacteria bacterium]|jgi:MYXO-CTERM domain-containing protein|nr:heparinase II/III family protein [Deltaproteobacteria bacterium]MBW2531759.1 heparinase II/III family protein [Deltaproteobacteria bacterium]